MFKIDGQYASPAGEFKPVNETTGEPATRISHEWLNTIQREILAVLAEASITPNKANDAQLKTAILNLIAANSGGGGGGGGTSSGGLEPVAATSNIFATNFKMYLADTSAGELDMYLPGGEEAKVIGVLDAGPYFGTNNLHVYPGTGQAIDIGAVLEGLDVDIDRAWVIFYQAAGSTKWEITSNMLATGGGASVPPASNTAPGTTSREYNTVITSPLQNATTAPNLYVRQSKNGKMVNITVSQLNVVTKDGSAGPLKFMIDAEYRPEDLTAFQCGARVDNVYKTNYFQVTPDGWVEFYDGQDGQNIAADTPNCGWSGNLSLTYSLY